MKLWEKVVEDNYESYKYLYEILYDAWKKFAMTGRCDDALCCMCPLYETLFCSPFASDNDVIARLNEEVE